MLSFDPHRTEPPAHPRPAATVVVVRPRGTGPGIEIFCVERHHKSAFLGGAVVFPGGKLDDADASIPPAALASPPSARAQDFAADDAAATALCVAACRESLEEAGLAPLVGDAPDLAATLRADLEGGRALADALHARAARLDLGALEPFARWVTPEAEQRRFDARFFLLVAPEGQEGSHDRHETTHSFWTSPAELLARGAAGEVFLAPPTMRTLELLADVATIAAARDWARAQCLDPICPHFFLQAETAMLALPGDPEHPVRARRIGGPTRFALRDGRFVSEDP